MRNFVEKKNFVCKGGRRSAAKEVKGEGRRHRGGEPQSTLKGGRVG